MKKIFISCLSMAFAVCLCAILTSCGGNSDNDDNYESADGGLTPGWYVNQSAVSDFESVWTRELNEFKQAGDYSGASSYARSAAGYMHIKAIHIKGDGQIEYGTCFSSSSEPTSNYWKNFSTSVKIKGNTVKLELYYSFSGGGYGGERPSTYTLTGNTMTLDNGDMLLISGADIIDGNSTYSLAISD